MRRPLIQTANATDAATATRSGGLEGIACGGAEGKECRRAPLVPLGNGAARLPLRGQPSGEAAALLHLP
ncbi:MAG: hypothetical protein J2P37_08460, partial [Ktedonobacteraceae bacterium]|nr:hypothetical protein [Ktedonobacteraceae bacterium]